MSTIMTTKGIDSSNTTTNSWRKQILQRLNQRKAREQKPFEEIINCCSRLFESIESLKSENVLLSIQKERLQSEIEQLTGKEYKGVTSPVYSSAEDQKKILQLQEELTELHRRRGENAQQIVQLRNTLEDKEAEIKSWKNKYQDSLISLDEYKKTCKTLQSRILELEEKNQTLLDEHTALQMAFNALEAKYLTREKENATLLQRYMALKARDAELMNQENEAAMKARLQAQQKAIESAIKEMPDASELEKDPNPALRLLGQEPSDPVCYMCCIPSRKIFGFEAHEAEINTVKWCSDRDVGSGRASLVLTGGGDRKVKLWEVSLHRSNAQCKTVYTGSNAAITSIDIEGDMILASSNDFASRVWTLDGKLRRTLTGHSNKVLSVKFLSGANRVVSGSHDRTLKIWDLNRHTCIRTLFAGSSCNDLVTSGGSESATIISGHFDKRIRFWETRTESTCNEILLDGRITSLALSNNGFHLLTCVRDDTLKQLDLRMNQVVRTFVADGFKVGCDWTRAVFSPDSEYVAAGSSDGSVFVWNLNSGKIEGVLKDHHGHNVITCAWSTNGKMFLSCDKSKHAVLWTD